MPTLSFKKLKHALRRHGGETRREAQASLHEQVVRRALLQSDYFSPALSVRLKKRLAGSFVSLPWALSSLTFGLFLAVVASPYLAAAPETPATLASLADAEPVDVLHALNQHGQVRYSGEDQAGAAVYLVNVNGQTYELHDQHAALQKLISR